MAILDSAGATPLLHSGGVGRRWLRVGGTSLCPSPSMNAQGRSERVQPGIGRSSALAAHRSSRTPQRRCGTQIRTIFVTVIRSTAVGFPRRRSSAGPEAVPGCRLHVDSHSQIFTTPQTMNEITIDGRPTGAKVGFAPFYSTEPSHKYAFARGCETQRDGHIMPSAHRDAFGPVLMVRPR